MSEHTCVCDLKLEERGRGGGRETQTERRDGGRETRDRERKENKERIY